MNKYLQKAIDVAAAALIPAAAWGMTLVVPVIPVAVWTALLKALLSGNITLEHVQQFLKDHDIKEVDEFPAERDKFGSH